MVTDVELDDKWIPSTIKRNATYIIITIKVGLQEQASIWI